MKKLFLVNMVCLSILTLTFTCCAQKSDKLSASIKKKAGKIIFNVPNLIGKNIDELRKTFGAPIDGVVDPERGSNTCNNTFEKNQRFILASFNPQSRKVIYFFFATNDPGGVTADYSDLLISCNVTKGNPNYSIEPVPLITDNRKYTGIKIIPH